MTAQVAQVAVLLVVLVEAMPLIASMSNSCKSLVEAARLLLGLKPVPDRSITIRAEVVVAMPGPGSVVPLAVLLPGVPETRTAMMVPLLVLRVVRLPGLATGAIVIAVIATVTGMVETRTTVVATPTAELLPLALGLPLPGSRPPPLPLLPIPVLSGAMARMVPLLEWVRLLALRLACPRRLPEHLLVFLAVSTH